MRSRVRVTRVQSWDLVKIDDLLSSSDHLGLYIKSIYIFTKILNLIADYYHLIIYKNY